MSLKIALKKKKVKVTNELLSFYKLALRGDRLSIVLHKKKPFFRDLFMFHRPYSNCRPQNSARYNRMICQTVENTSVLERLSCILHACARGYHGYTVTNPIRSSFRRRNPANLGSKSVFGFAERKTRLIYLTQGLKKNAVCT